MGGGFSLRRRRKTLEGQGGIGSRFGSSLRFSHLLTRGIDRKYPQQGATFHSDHIGGRDLPKNDSSSVHREGCRQLNSQSSGR